MRYMRFATVPAAATAPTMMTIAVTPRQLPPLEWRGFIRTLPLSAVPPFAPTRLFGKWDGSCYRYFLGGFPHASRASLVVSWAGSA